MLLAESISKQANALADLYEEAGITTAEIFGANQMIDVQANLA